MKKELVFILFTLLMVSSISAVTSNAGCSLNASLINQDPYPAVPGEVLTLVFQITGVQNPVCGKVQIELLESFPFTVDPESNKIIEVQSGTFVQDFGSFLLAPYKVRVDKDAVDGDNTIRLSMKSSAASTISRFNINVKDSRTDFEVSIKNYEKSTRTLTFEILNTGKNDIEALTIEIPKQEKIEIKGSNRNIIGSLDSNDDTTFSFEAIPKDGEINLIILYTDESNERRIVEKSVVFDSDYFAGRVSDEDGAGFGTYFLIIIILAVLYFWWRARKKKKHPHHFHH
jgi:hypothetical protein